jgi:septal ring factor EnvC (AmiA/AmiB activator)
MYEAMRAQRNVIESQLQDQQSLRRSIAERLRDGGVTGADRAGLEARLTNVDARITQLDAALATAQAQEARAAGEPGAIVQQPDDPTEDIVEVFAVVSVIFMFVFVLPMSIAWARRIWRKHAYVVSLTPEMTQRLDSIDRAVEATAIEVERIGEGQRFVTQLLASRADAARIAPPQDANKG